MIIEYGSIGPARLQGQLPRRSADCLLPIQNSFLTIVMKQIRTLTVHSVIQKVLRLKFTV